MTPPTSCAPAAPARSTRRNPDPPSASNGLILHQAGSRDQAATPEARAAAGPKAELRAPHTGKRHSLARLMQFPRVVVPHCGARVSVAGSDLHVAQVGARVGHGRDIRV